MKHNLKLVKLTTDQITRAKEANGRRKRITHALICGPYGQMFGTEKQCLKYFTVWDPAYRIEVQPGKFKSILPGLFDKAVKTDKYEIVDFQSTPELTMKLIEASESVPSATRSRREPNRRPRLDAPDSGSTKAKKKSVFFGWLFP